MKRALSLFAVALSATACLGTDNDDPQHSSGVSSETQTYACFRHRSTTWSCADPAAQPDDEFDSTCIDVSNPSECSSDYDGDVIGECAVEHRTSVVRVAPGSCSAATGAAGSSSAGSPTSASETPAVDAACARDANGCGTCCVNAHDASLTLAQTIADCACDTCSSLCGASSLCITGNPDPSSACAWCAAGWLGADPTPQCEATRCLGDPTCTALLACLRSCPKQAAGGSSG